MQTIAQAKLRIAEIFSPQVVIHTEQLTLKTQHVIKAITGYV